ncbi:hypothetical protein BDK51DRAFT_36608 [Blyttiomyces helicus]|uniref:Uncharacterized protein n=1 Tax=Blyttiomyces helicus TaxID=388810 RepID=A0A4P9W406_9FUNG|nr:hypothetical protein BDK51DRAFT_36608 [Blyttiomyces helicus]|eukprot:RKO86592.1 hypothetical protein BDK51DRAFT_36608 [Blyttiomyces helicus]
MRVESLRLDRAPCSFRRPAVPVAVDEDGVADFGSRGEIVSPQRRSFQQYQKPVCGSARPRLLQLHSDSRPPFKSLKDGLRSPRLATAGPPMTPANSQVLVPTKKFKPSTNRSSLGAQTISSSPSRHKHQQISDPVERVRSSLNCRLAVLPLTVAVLVMQLPSSTSGARHGPRLLPQLRPRSGDYVVAEDADVPALRRQLPPRAAAQSAAHHRSPPLRALIPTTSTRGIDHLVPRPTGATACSLSSAIPATVDHPPTGDDDWRHSRSTRPSTAPTQTVFDTSLSVVVPPDQAEELLALDAWLPAGSSRFD